MQCREIYHNAVSVHPELGQLLPFLADGAALARAVLLYLLDEGAIFAVGLEDESLADQLRRNDLLLVVELALGFVEDQLARLFRLLELLLNSFCIFWLVLLLLAVSS